MGWDRVKDYKPFFYSIRLLKTIASNYDSYNPDSSEFDTQHWKEVIELKADFDRALKSLGAKRRRVIKAGMEAKTAEDIKEGKGISNYRLRQQGFYAVGKFRNESFGMMCDFLNGGNKE